MKRLLLDDERSLKQIFIMTKNKIYLESWSVVRNYNEFIKYIKKSGIPNIISFDHDLGSGKTGMDCAHYIVDLCLNSKKDLPEILVHSQNPVGKKNILSLFDSYKKYISEYYKTT